MHAFTNTFERRWFWIFMAIWAFICLPLPIFYDTEYNPSFFGVPLFIYGTEYNPSFFGVPLFIYDTEYNPSFFGVPLFIYGWLVYGLFTIIMIGVWAASCLKRPEYHEFDEDDPESTEGSSK